MTGPLVTNNGGLFVFRWTEGDHNGLAVRIDKLREDSRTGVTGEIVVNFGATGHIHMTRYSLLSTRSRSEVARFCESRLAGFDWPAILELVSVKTIQAWRAGEPVVVLGDVAIPEKLEYRLVPLLLEHSPNLVYGEGGLGKSYLAACFAVMVQEAVILGQMAPEPGPVLYLDYETSQHIAARRFRMIHQGLDLDPSPKVLYRFCHLPFAHDVEEIQRTIVDRNIQLVIIDSAGPACGGEPEAASAAIQFFTALRSLRITSLILAHKAKHTGGVGPFGSVYWLNYPRNVYELKKSQETGAETIHLAILHRKANEGTLLPPSGVRLTFRVNAVKPEIEPVPDVPEFEAELPVVARIEEHLRHGDKLTVKELSEALDIPEGSVRPKLNQYKNDRFRQFTDNGVIRWALLEKRYT